MKFECFYPQDTWVVTQRWGVYRPDVYAQFGFTCHNGIDTRLAPNKYIRMPFDGEVINIDYQPKGGGIYISVMSKHRYTFPDGIECNVLWDFLHLEKTLVVPYTQHEVGTIIAIGDNTGFSTGPHTHHQIRRVYKERGTWRDVDKNESNNSFDPTPYFVGSAKDMAALTAKVRQATLAVKQLLSFNKQVWAK